MDDRDLLHAYAVLELSPPVSEALLKSRYKTLVRRWHPDRFQSDPVGQAEATQRLRDINLAYELLTTYLEVAEQWLDAQPEAEQEQGALPGVQTDRPFSWTPERVDAVVESINRLNSWSVVPEMSLHRWLSLSAVFVYMFVSTILLPAGFGNGSRDVARAFSRASAYFWLPLYLIWAGDRDGLDRVESLFYRVTGWVLMAAPAVVAIGIWIAG